jgi:hypothetical protein
LVALSQKDSEKDEKQRTLTGLLETVILFIRKGDYERLQAPVTESFDCHYTQASSPFEGLIKELVSWIKMDQDTLVYHLADFKQESFNMISMKVLNLLKGMASERDTNREKCKKLEVDKKFKELEALRKRIAEIDIKKARDMEEKLKKIRESGFNMSATENISEMEMQVMKSV